MGVLGEPKGGSGVPHRPQGRRDFCGHRHTLPVLIHSSLQQLGVEYLPVPGTVLGARDKTLGKTENRLPARSRHCRARRQKEIDNKQNRENSKCYGKSKARKEDRQD